jgi:hypothetical protein
LRTGTDSPVSADSSTSRSRTRVRRRSAGTRTPEVSTTTSPGTRSRLGDLARLAAAHHLGARRAHLRERLHRLLGAQLLPEADDAFSSTTPRMTPASV